MKKSPLVRNFLNLAFIFSLIAPIPCFAKGGNGNGSGHGNDNDHKNNSGKQTKITLNLTPSDALLTDLATSTGKFKSKTGKKPQQLKGNLKVPFSATSSIGVTNSTTAATADIHLELSREGVVYDDCTLSYDAKADDSSEQEQASSAVFKLFVKNTGKHNVKGSCASGGVPAVQNGDSVVAYAVVNATRINFLSN